MLRKLLSLVVIFCVVSIATADLVSQYDFEGTWNNSVTGGLIASARAGASLASDAERGGAANLDSTKWLHVGYDGNIVINTQLSLATWVRSTSTNWSANNRIMGRGYVWAIQVQSSAYAGFSSSAGGAVLTGSSPINDGYWHHIALTWDCITGERKLYVDGVLDTEDVVTVTAIPNTSRYSIGARATSSTAADKIYRGYVDDVRVYNSILTASEISQIYSPVDPCVEAPEMDFNDDCVVDLADFAIFAQDWFVCGFWDAFDCE